MQSTHWLIHFLRKRKRNGLAQAVENLITELMLVGFIALLLTVLQGPISKICGEMGRTYFCTARSWLVVPARQKRFVVRGCGQAGQHWHANLLTFLRLPVARSGIRARIVRSLDVNQVGCLRATAARHRPLPVWSRPPHWMSGWAVGHAAGFVLPNWPLALTMTETLAGAHPGVAPARSVQQRQGL